MKLLTLAALAAGAAAQAIYGRVEASIDWGWRFALGASVNGQCQFDYSVNMTNVQCDGLTQSIPGAASAAACQQVACNTGAQVYQWCDGSGQCGVQSCWIGSAASCGNPQTGWVSFAVNTSAPWVPAAALPSFDDSSWQVVDLPHDFDITGQYSQTGTQQGEAFLPLNVSFYRKTFAIPDGWAVAHLEIVIQGALSTSSWWLNGVPLVSRHTSGYTPLVLRIDNVPGLNIGNGTTNVLTAYVDGTETTGWWYEGEGLIRSNNMLIAKYIPAYITTFGVQTPHFIDGAYHARNTTAEGLYADSVVLTPTVTIANDYTTKSYPTVRCTVYAADGVTVVGSSTTTNTTLLPGSQADIRPPPITINNAELWSIPRPYLHTMVVELIVAGMTIDSYNVTVGFRSLRWDPEDGLYINDQAVKMRGWCNHESFAGVGAALPDRVDLLRIQQIRGMGGNAWRTSHNAPEPVLLDLTDRLGLAVMDENRVFATTTNCPGCPNVPTYAGTPVDDFTALVVRDRNHPSVVWWSFCNEAGCGQGGTEPALDFRLAAYANDGSRFVGANMGWLSPITPTNMSALLDVMGFSHASYNSIVNFHQLEPGKPLVMSECCSCETQRGEDADMQSVWTNNTFYSDEDSGCIAGQTQTSNGVDWMAGTFVWTAHDYYGEPDKWPHISSSFGQIDLSGFPKESSWWYRAWWFGNVPATDAGRPPVPGTSTFVKIVESWQAPVGTATGRTIHVYTNAPQTRLVINGANWGNTASITPYQAAVFTGVPYSAGSITALALDASGNTLATDTAYSWGAPAAIVLSIDAPSPTTGTGSAVYLDGHDVALLRATVVDAAGRTCQNASANVTFAVTAGPGYISGIGNGNPADQNPNHAPWRPAYHGLVRAIVQVNVLAVGGEYDRFLASVVNVDAGKGGARTTTILQGANPVAPTSITVTASAPGLTGASITIPLSVDPADAVLAVASRSVGQADTGY